MASSTKQAMVLISGTSFSQLVLIAATPVLTRIYSPHEFGLLSVFLAVTSTVAVIANGRYDQAIMVAATFEEAIEVCVLSVIVALAVSLVALIAAIFWAGPIATSLGTPDLAPWMLLAPVAIFLSALFSSLTYLNNRLSRYGEIAKVTVIRSIIAVTTQIGIGLIRNGASGLIIGQVLSNLVSNGRLLPAEARRQLAALRFSKWRDLRILAKRYMEFPLYSGPSGLLSTLNQSAINVFLAIFFTPAAAGLFAVTRRTMIAPLNQIATPIGQIFFREASEEVRETGSAEHAFDKTVKKLAIIGLPTFAVGFFIVEDVFRLAFGAEWAEAGKLAQVLIPLFAVRFIVSPLSAMATIASNRELLIVNAGLTVAGVGALYIGNELRWTFISSLLLMSLSSSVVYLLYFARLRRLSRKGRKTAESCG